MTDIITRRRAIATLGGIVGALAYPFPGQAAGRVLSPESFGAKGDGKSDDYHALLRLAEAARGATGARILFGRNKVYRIEQISIRGGPAKGGASDIVFRDCRSLIIDLNGSTIDVKGDFHRAASSAATRKPRSFVTAVQPVIFRDCVGVILRNGILAGNADKMTKDAGVTEMAGRGILIQGCKHVVLEDLHIHHFSTDGIQIYPNAAGEVSEDISLARVRATNNARQGLTVGGGVGVTATDCSFSENGFTGGPYHHAPGAGVDLEPNRKFDRRSDFRAIRCRFDNNRGSALVAGSPDMNAFVELIDCSGTSKSPGRLILSSERSLIRGGSWRNIQIACAYAAHRAFQHDISIEVTASTWTGDDPRWAPVYDLSPRRPAVHIHDNRFELRASGPFAPTYLFNCSNPNHRFENNEVFVSRRGHDGAGIDLVGRFGGAIVRGNRWSTDARAPLRFVNNYQKAKLVTAEQFSGSFGPGWVGQ